MTGTLRLARGFIALAIPAILFLAPATSHSNCSGGGPAQMLGNVVWFMKDSLTACPAGDSVLAGRPCRLRISIEYADANCNAVVGVPPESIWVTVQSTTGNLKVNDEGAKIAADDSTDVGGDARITIPSFSGNGTVSLKLWVSGVSQGTKSGVVRTVDFDAGGRVDTYDYFNNNVDINYSGSVDTTDFRLILTHLTDWHRNCLFGTPIRRTTTCDTCTPDTTNTLGDDFSWSPNGRMLAVTLFDTSRNCAIYLIPADAAVGNRPIPFSMPPHVSNPQDHDYSPQWSPLGKVIFWNRGDFYMLHKGIYGQNPDTTTDTLLIKTTLVTMSEMCLSPDGQTLAFEGRTFGGQYHLFTVPDTGGTPTQITSAGSSSQHFPQWSSDGTKIIYQFGEGGAGTHLYEVASTGGTPVELDAGDVATSPYVSSDDAIVLFARGASSLVTATYDPSTSATRSIANYANFTNPGYAEQKISPDGTRLALRAVPPGTSHNPSVWAVRRNMSLPPQFSSFGGQFFVDSTLVVPVSVLQGYTWTGAAAARDSEGDQLTFQAFFMPSGMSFDSTTQVLSYTPPAGTSGQTFNVKLRVTTPSGGTDSFIAQFTVTHPLNPMAARLIAAGVRLVGPNPVRESFEIVGDFGTVGARLRIYDVGGRIMADIGNRSANHVAWNLRSEAGTRVEPGLYFYRLTSALPEARGKFTVVR